MFGRIHKWHLALCFLLNYPYLIQRLPFWSIFHFSITQVKRHRFPPLSPLCSMLSLSPSIAINACEISNGGCSTKAICKRTTPGSRECVCKAGYTGDGIVCLGRCHPSPVRKDGWRVRALQMMLLCGLLLGQATAGVICSLSGWEGLGVWKCDRRGIKVCDSKNHFEKRKDRNFWWIMMVT